jgi:hypothetical protein
VSSRTGLGVFEEEKITSIHHDSNTELSSLQRVAVVTSVAIHTATFKTHVTENFILFICVKLACFLLTIC